MLPSHGRMKRHPEAAKNIRPLFPPEYQPRTSCVGKTAQPCPVQLSARSRRTGPPANTPVQIASPTSPDEARAKLEHPSPLSRRGTESAHATSEEAARLHPASAIRAEQTSDPSRIRTGIPTATASQAVLREKERRKKKRECATDTPRRFKPTQHEQQKSSTPMSQKEKNNPAPPHRPHSHRQPRPQTSTTVKVKCSSPTPLRLSSGLKVTEDMFRIAASLGDERPHRSRAGATTQAIQMKQVQRRSDARAVYSHV